MLRHAATALLRGGRRDGQEWVQRAAYATRLTYVPDVDGARVRKVTLVPGDGIGPEIAECVEAAFDKLKVPIVFERFGHIRGSTRDGSPVEEVDEDLLESIRKNKVCFKGTLFTPLSATNTSTQSYNVRLRKALDLHINLVQGFTMPGVPTRHKDVNIVIIRENTEGEYSGLEHEVVPDVIESIKVITAEKSRRTAEYAFAHARLNNRPKVHVIHKANIMKLTDGLFIKCAKEVSEGYAGHVDVDFHIVDNAAQQLVQRPTQYSVILTSNLYGAVLGNILAGVCGGAGLLPGANIGPHASVWEQGARHVGRDIAGKGLANPTAALLSAAMMLRHLSLADYTDRLEEAVLGAVADLPASGKTPDIGGTGTTATLMSAVLERL